jgi:predicted DCC family thiol-disulfide oxidoreductase YuxK
VEIDCWDISVIKSSSKPPTRTVFYDGSCPLCVTEIKYYNKIDTHQSLQFIDVSANDFHLNGNLNQMEAMARFHVLTSDGELLSGAAAFVEVWQGLPRWRLLAKVFAFPGLTFLLELVYRVFLLVRPISVRLFVIAQRVSGKYFGLGKRRP